MLNINMDVHNTMLPLLIVAPTNTPSSFPLASPAHHLTCPLTPSLHQHALHSHWLPILADKQGRLFPQCPPHDNEPLWHCALTAGTGRALASSRLINTPGGDRQGKESQARLAPHRLRSMGRREPNVRRKERGQVKPGLENECGLPEVNVRGVARSQSFRVAHSNSIHRHIRTQCVLTTRQNLVVLPPSESTLPTQDSPHIQHTHTRPPDDPCTPPELLPSHTHTLTFAWRWPAARQPSNLRLPPPPHLLPCPPWQSWPPATASASQTCRQAGRQAARPNNCVVEPGSDTGKTAHTSAPIPQCRSYPRLHLKPHGPYSPFSSEYKLKVLFEGASRCFKVLYLLPPLPALTLPPSRAPARAWCAWSSP